MPVWLLELQILTDMTLRRATIEEALNAMSSHRVRRAQSERVTLAAASGRILSGPVIAPEDVPPFTRSRVDGFAVVADDVRGASQSKPVALAIKGDVQMGRPAGAALQAGEAIRIPTGGMLPAGATGVVMIEDTQVRDGVVEIHDESHCSDNLTRAGYDVRRGAELLQAGRVLDPGSIGMLAGAGVAELAVYRKPSVALLVTGDELVESDGTPLQPGQIRDINRLSLSAMLAALGFAPRAYPRVPDDRAAFARAFDGALAENDALVISGGSSVGERDYTPDVVAAAGEPGVIVHGIRAKPGRPTLLAVVGEKLVIGLPGNPVSALVMLEALGKPLLLRMFDKRDETIPVRAVLAADIHADDELEFRIPVKLRRARGDRPAAEPIIGTSAQMHILGLADAIVVAPMGAGRIRAGTEVDAIPFTRSTSLR